MTTYQGYESWKNWSEGQFMFTAPGDAVFYAGEFRGVDLAGRNLLEIGFGNGSFLNWAREQRANVFGVEILDTACDRARKAGIDVLSARLSDNVPQFSNFFDVVVAFDVLEHLTIAEIHTFLDDLSKLLKPGGLFLARFPNGQSPFVGVHQHSDHTHRSILSLGVMMQLIQGRPFRMIRAGDPFRGVSGAPLQRLKKIVQFKLQDLVQFVMRAIYGFDARMATNMVVVLQKNSEPG